MHQNHYFLKHLAAELDQKLVGHQLLSCFSQSKDELILGFSDNQSDFYIKADLSEQQGILSFASDFKRANKNSVDLFHELTGLRVNSVAVHRNERSFHLSFEEGPHLVFKLFGRQSNILLFKNAHPQLFKSQNTRDLNLELAGFDRNIDQSQESYNAAQGDLKQIFPTFGQLLTDYLISNSHLKKDSSGQWEMIQELLIQLSKPVFYVTIYKKRVHLSLVPVGEIIAQYSTAIEALNEFYFKHIQINGLEKEKNIMIRQLEQKITRVGNYIIKAKSKLAELSLKRNDQVADIIMANLHQIPTRASKIELLDFYNNKNISIKLNPKLSAQKNAEKFYQKNKNQSIEIRKVNESISTKQKELQQAENLLEEVKAFVDLRPFRERFKREQIKTKAAKELPYHQFEIDHFVVLVGKNAKSNDQLTLKYAHKDDMWFHARDVAGSHVVLKYQSGKNFPMNVIERTAQIAAWYSKGKNFPLCPVVHTLKKFVRKPKGSAPGKVKLDREDVILVEPKNIR